MTDPNAFPRRLLRAEQVLASRTRALSVVLEGSHDPHNVHAVLRTAEALGVQDVHLVAPRGEAAVIAPGVTQRSHDWLTVTRHDGLDDAVTALRAEGREIWATSPRDDAEPLTGLGLRQPTAVLFGNETEGLSERALEMADRIVRIDLVGFSGSLNLSVSAAIVLWELRRVAVNGTEPGDLGEEARADLRRDWYSRLLGRRLPEPEELDDWLRRGEDVARAARGGQRLRPAEGLRSSRQRESRS